MTALRLRGLPLIKLVIRIYKIEHLISYSFVFLIVFFLVVVFVVFVVILLLFIVINFVEPAMSGARSIVAILLSEKRMTVRLRDV